MKFIAALVKQTVFFLDLWKSVNTHKNLRVNIVILNGDPPFIQTKKLREVKKLEIINSYVF